MCIYKYFLSFTAFYYMLANYFVELILLESNMRNLHGIKVPGLVYKYSKCTLHILSLLTPFSLYIYKYISFYFVPLITYNIICAEFILLEKRKRCLHKTDLSEIIYKQSFDVFKNTLIHSDFEMNIIYFSSVTPNIFRNNPYKPL